MGPSDETVWMDAMFGDPAQRASLDTHSSLTSLGRFASAIAMTPRAEVADAKMLTLPLDTGIHAPSSAAAVAV
jgi:hypothetical protein